MSARSLMACAVLLYAGCATDTQLTEGKRLLAQGRTEAGLDMIEQAVRANPRQNDVRAYWLRERELALARLAAEAGMARAEGRLEAAEALYARAIKLDPTDTRAREGIDALVAARRHRSQLTEAQARFERKEHEAAEAIVRLVLAENAAHAQARALLRLIVDAAASRGINPQVLTGAASKQVDLEFRDAPLRNVFEVISKTSGINFVFDKDVRADLRSTIDVRNGTVDDVIRMILMTNQLERKVLNERTILVYPNTPAKAKEYQELAVRSFYLANADVKQTLAMIKTMVKTRDVFIDEKLGLLVMKDTPEAIRLAEKLIAAHDIAEPEVTLEVEVLEVGTSRIQELGVRFPEQVLFQDPVSAAAAGTGAASPLMRASGSLVGFVATPAIIVNLRQQDGTTNVLANPRIRVKNREKARVHIGDRVPVVTTTATANVGVSASVNYLDVGLKLDVEPAMQLEGDIVIKVGLEVSNIVREVPVTGGGLAYQLGTRNAATVLRLRDGETQVLAGLIQDEDRRTANRVPGLGNLPIVGRLFSNNNDTRSKTEIVLLITPRVVRAITRPDYVATEYYAGTDAAIGAKPLGLRPARALVSMTAAGGQSAPSARAQGPDNDNPLAGQADLQSDRPQQAAAIGLSGPSRAAPGSEVSITLQLDGDAPEASAQMELVYDPAVLSPRSAPAGAKPGRLPVVLGRERRTQAIALQVISKRMAGTQLRVENAMARIGSGSPVPAALPPALSIDIAP